MKFARYLEDTQTPEWQRAYLDYRLLKKRIKAIEREKAASLVESPISTVQDPRPRVDSEASAIRSVTSQNSSKPSISSSKIPQIQETGHVSSPSLMIASNVADQQSRISLHRSQTLPAPPSLNSRERIPSFSRILSSSKLSRRLTQLGPRPHPYSELSLRDLMPLLSPLEREFFSTLDAELEKIETFYIAREEDMKTHTKLLEQQLNELNEHRKLFYAAYPSGRNSAINTNAIFKLKAKLLKEEEAAESAGSAVKAKGKATVRKAAAKLSDTATSSSQKLAQERGANYHTDHGTVHLNPDEYYSAKHQLKKALLEHYKGLETLQNYRILNVTGIRKALKKFQKVTKIAAQNAYMTEKVDTAAFSSEASVRSMMDDMEEMYATRFAHGDKKQALERLRSTPYRSHHVNTFWSGLFVGLAAPALASGLYHSYQQSTRDDIPGWDALLLVYGVFLVPVLFSLLVGLNVLVWTGARINYVFIFEFDPRTRMDHREYFVTPSLLLAALCYAFWLSFARIGASSIDPTIWPLVWLAFTAVIMFDPFPFLFKPSRYWLLKSIGKLLTSGTRRVEFADFWMGDQFCSLVFTLSNLYLVVCLYAEGYNSKWRQCGSASRFWPLAFVLGVLPFLVRLIQSVKRYVDSGLNTHMVNGGKYGAGIVAYLCYFIWRHKASNHGPSFVVWCIFQTLYSFYALAWDLLMDWSVMSPRAKYPFLRQELVYTNHIYCYYFAIFSNTLIRFIWVIYIPTQGPDPVLRTFIGGLLEMLRRWQWNFYRAENEHLGNMDQYRVTREVPLPYSLDARRDDDADDEDDVSPTRDWLPQRAIRLRLQKAVIDV